MIEFFKIFYSITLSLISMVLGWYSLTLEPLQAALLNLQSPDARCAGLEGKYEAWTDNNLMGNCYTELAVVMHDPSYCEKITGKYLDIVKSQCYTATAFSMDDPSVCGMYDSSYNNSFCYSWVSDIKNDPGQCLNIKDEYERNGCLWRHESGNFSDGFYFCEELKSQKAKDMCNQVKG